MLVNGEQANIEFSLNFCLRTGETNRPNLRILIPKNRKDLRRDRLRGYVRILLVVAVLRLRLLPVEAVAATAGLVHQDASQLASGECQPPAATSTSFRPRRRWASRRTTAAMATPTTTWAERREMGDLRHSRRDGDAAGAGNRLWWLRRRTDAVHRGSFVFLGETGAASAGWKAATTPSGAASAYPPGWHVISGDPGTAWQP